MILHEDMIAGVSAKSKVPEEILRDLACICNSIRTFTLRGCTPLSSGELEQIQQL
jgi:hypothetical protein